MLLSSGEFNRVVGFFCMFYSIVVLDEKTPQKVVKNI